MGLDTEIKGDPTSVEAAGTWLTSTLAPKVDSSVDALTKARTTAEADWDGTAGTAFAATMRSSATKTTALHSEVTSTGQALSTFGAQLRTAQHDMADVRSTASAAGLTVSGFTITDPGPGPAKPAYIAPGTQLPIEEANTYNSALKAYDDHQVLVTAYDTACTRVKEIWDAYERHSKAITDKYRGLQGAQWVLTASDISGGIAGGVMEFKASSLRGTGEYFKGLSAQHLEWARNADPGVVGRTRWYADLDDATKMGQNADDLIRSADDLKAGSKSIPLKAGGVLAVAGIAYDIYNGKDPVQATVSGGLGFGASVAAGAAIGTLIPVPVVGTAVGAIVGAGVGIFTSGMVDNLFEGGDLGDAAAAGVDAVKDTGGAIVDGVESVGSAIGGLFD